MSSTYTLSRPTGRKVPAAKLIIFPNNVSAFFFFFNNKPWFDSLIILNNQSNIISIGKDRNSSWLGASHSPLKGLPAALPHKTKLYWYHCPLLPLFWGVIFMSFCYFCCTLDLGEKPLVPPPHFGVVLCVPPLCEWGRDPSHNLTPPKRPPWPPQIPKLPQRPSITHPIPHKPPQNESLCYCLWLNKWTWFLVKLYLNVKRLQFLVNCMLLWGHFHCSSEHFCLQGHRVTWSIVHKLRKKNYPSDFLLSNMLVNTSHL